MCDQTNKCYSALPVAFRPLFLVIKTKVLSLRESHAVDGARVGSASGSDGVSLLDTCDPVHLVLVRVDAATGDRELVSSTLLEWRAVLASEQRGDADGVVGTALELNGVGPENKVPVGVLTLRLQLVPKCVSLLFSVLFSVLLSAVAFAFACWLHSRTSHSRGPFEPANDGAMLLDL